MSTHDSVPVEVLNNIGISMSGNIPVNQDPKFIDPQNGNFHLRQDSPAIDVGIDVGITKDQEGKPRPNGSKPDMGAYEFIGQGDPVPPSPPKNVKVE